VGHAHRGSRHPRQRVAGDADALLKEFVAKLRESGHSLGGVSFTVGATKTLTTTGAVMELTHASH
jgi:hypothetical protein